MQGDSAPTELHEGARPARGRERRYRWMLGACLALLTAVAYAPVVRNGFVNLDDHAYLTGNSLIQPPYSWNKWLYLVVDRHVDNWHPLTWVSHALDWRLFGNNPVGHHLVNLAMHILAVIALFGALLRLTARLETPRNKSGLGARASVALNRTECCALVAALFAVHPLHVESVAWASERKDVLCALFWWLSLWAYAGYAARPGRWRFLGVAGWFVLGLLSKPMIMTLPVTLLVLDFWPLDRFQKNGTWSARARCALLLVLEKLPLFLLSAAAAMATLWAQESAQTLDPRPRSWRIANAAVSAATYLWQCLVPTSLACFYPFSRSAYESAVIVSVALLALVSGVALFWRRSRPYVLAGWLWYLITLAPVLGILQFGRQARADRYTYVPLVGIFWIVAWGLAEWSAHSQQMGRIALRMGIGLWMLTLATICAWQVTYWRNDDALFTHALAVGGDNAFVRSCLGGAYLLENELPAAVEELRRALELQPDDDDTRRNLAIALERLGDPEALKQYDVLWQRHPQRLQAILDLALCEATHPDLSSRRPHHAVRLAEGAAAGTNQQNAMVLDILAASYASAGRIADAVATADRAIAVARSQGNERLACEIAERRAHYQAGQIRAPSPRTQPESP
jgi:tetratricopeptide (TPR) repeat protein